MTKTDEHDPVGSTFESWLEEEGILEEATEHAVKAVISWQLQKTMAERAQQEVDGFFNGNVPITAGSASRPGERRRHLEKPDARRPPGRKKDQDRPRGCCLIQYAVMLIEAVRRPLPVTRLLRSARNDRKRTVIARSAATKQSHPSAAIAGSVSLSSSALASLRSAVSRPSVNQPRIGASRAAASCGRPCWRRRRARLIAPRNSQDFAFCHRATSMACCMAVSASLTVPAPASNASPPSRWSSASSGAPPAFSTAFSPTATEASAASGLPIANCASACNVSSQCWLAPRP